MAKRNIWRSVVTLGVALGLALITVVSPGFLVASDHDDGEAELKGRNLNLTDLYAFREVDQNASVGPQCTTATAQCDLIFIMNTNPRSVARQRYFFSTGARYEFRAERAASPTAAPTAAGLASPDVTLRFEFDEPTTANQQSIKVTAIRDGQKLVATTTTSGGAILTTPLTFPATSPVVNSVSLGGSTLQIFAGLREDPFFFDVEQYFRVRAGFAGLGPMVFFRSPGVDFTLGYNVNAIVVRVPRAFLQASTSATTFDVWETISVPDELKVRDALDQEGFIRFEDDDFVQIERLARPAINEGLILSNDLLNAWNRVGPDCDARALAGQQPCASVLGPVFAQAVATLAALGNNAAQIGGIVSSFVPDVMRINTAIASGYANGAAFDTAGNITSGPKGGRKILDDVIDITLIVVVPGGAPAGAVIANVESDNVAYSPAHQNLLNAFPYLAPPN